MITLAIITGIALILSFIADYKKTFKGLKIALKKFIHISIPLAFVIILVSITLYFIPGNKISFYLSNGNKYIGFGIALLLGSVTLMPGFVAFPLSGILKDNNVLFMTISAFTTTLMMVGILTFPVEKKYFGTKVAILRNAISLFIAIVIAVITGLLYKEIF